MSELKRQAAQAALKYIEDDMIVGVGTGSTVNYFIEALTQVKGKIDACVASSVATEKKLREAGIPVIDLNACSSIPVYIDGADEVNALGQMIKGGGGALTREKIVASASKKFICIADKSKKVNRLGHFPLAVEVIPMARSFVARELVKMGGDPEYREGFVSDNGNIILDVFNLEIDTPIAMEEAITLIPGVVENGLFARRMADLILLASEEGVETIKPE